MSVTSPSQRWIDRWFTVVLAFKGINGALEIIGAIGLLLLPNSALHNVLGQLISWDGASSSDILVKSLQSFNNSLTPGTQLYAAIYFMMHGVIKVGLVAALLSRKYALYPGAIVVLVLFMVYQIYRITTGASVILDVSLTIVDGVVVCLTWLEYRSHTQTGLPVD